MSEIDLIKERIRMLEELSELRMKHEQECRPMDMRKAAGKMALHSIVRELLLREGLSQQQIDTHFRVRTEHYLDLLLQKSRDIGPSLAAQSDDRDQDEVPTETEFPPLFP